MHAVPMGSRVLAGRRAVIAAVVAVTGVLMAGSCRAPVDPARGSTSPRATVSSTESMGTVGRAALDRGVRWLIDHQNPDGSWGSFESARPMEIYLGTVASHRAFKDSTSALAVMALIEPARRDAAAMEALRRGVAYLVAVEPSLRANGDTFYNVWTHTFLTQAAARLLASGLLPDQDASLRRLLDREISLLISTQAADGGWGYYDFDHQMAVPSGDMTTSFNTASVLLALRDAEAVGRAFPPQKLEEGLAVVERLRLPSGAYVYGTYAQLRPGAPYNMVAGSLGRSQPCNLALHLYARGVDLAELEAGLSRMRQDHKYLQIGLGRPRPHEAYYQTSGYYYLYGHYYAAEAAALLPMTPRRDYSTWLIDVLAGIQGEDGSWLDFPMYGYGHAYGTSFAVLALEACLRSLESGS